MSWPLIAGAPSISPLATEKPWREAHGQGKGFGSRGQTVVSGLSQTQASPVSGFGEKGDDSFTLIYYQLGNKQIKDAMGCAP